MYLLALLNKVAEKFLNRCCSKELHIYKCMQIFSGSVFGDKVNDVFSVHSVLRIQIEYIITFRLFNFKISYGEWFRWWLFEVENKNQ